MTITPGRNLFVKSDIYNSKKTYTAFIFSLHPLKQFFKCVKIPHLLLVELAKHLFCRSFFLSSPCLKGDLSLMGFESDLINKCRWWDLNLGHPECRADLEATRPRRSPSTNNLTISSLQHNILRSFCFVLVLWRLL